MIPPQEVTLMTEFSVQQVFRASFRPYAAKHILTNAQSRAASSICSCKTGELGCNVSVCGACGYKEFHNNSCRSRSCPMCQALLKEVWIDARKAEVINTSYFHLVFTVPAQLNPFFILNQDAMYGMFHKCAAQTILELSSDRRYLGAVPGIIQVLHTWGQEMNYHPHIHCIVTGGGLSRCGRFIYAGRRNFFLPARVLAGKFRGKFLSELQSLFMSGKMTFPKDFRGHNSYEWKEFRNSLYKTGWIAFARETFNGFGNAIDYLGRYTHRIAISNSRLTNVTGSDVTFFAKDYRSGKRKEITLTHEEFIHRFLQHVLPAGFRRIRYYGLLNNRSKKKNLELISRITGTQPAAAMLQGLDNAGILMVLFHKDICVCPACGERKMRPYKFQSKRW